MAKIKKEKVQELESEKLEVILQYKSSIEANKDKSQDDFEKSIYLLASGGLVVSLMTIDKFLDKLDIISLKDVFALGLLGFVCTLLTNLLSHRRSIKESENLINLINENPECIFEEEFTNNLKRGNKKIEFLNYASISSLIIGASSILIFFTINFFSMSNLPKPTNPTTPATEPKPTTGRANPAPPTIVIPKK